MGSRLGYFCDHAKHSRIADIVILIGLKLFIFRGLVVSEVNLAGDWPYFFDSYVLDYLSPPFAWLHLYMGGYAPFDLYRYPIRIAQASLTYFFSADYAWGVRLLYFFPFLLVGPPSFYYLAHSLFQKRMISFGASIFYLANDFILWRVVIGQPTIIVPYALLPLILFSFAKGLKENRMAYGLTSGLVLGISMFYDLRISLLSFAVALSYFFYHLLTSETPRRLVGNVKRLFKILTYPFIPVSVCGILHSYWILPAMVVWHPMPITSSGYDQPYWVKSLSYSTITQTLTMTHWYWLYDLGRNWSSSYLELFWPIAVVTSILVFLSILLRPKDLKVLYLSLLALMSIFLSKGSNPPFGEIYTWLFVHLPGFSAFREPLKFMFVLPLFSSLLYGVAADGIIHGLQIRHRRLSKMIQATTFSAAVLMVLVIASPIIANQPGMLRPEKVPEEYSRLNHWIEAQPEGRIFWVPYLPSYITMDHVHPALASAFLSNFGSYYPSLSFQKLLLANDTRNLAKILGLSNVRYVLLYPPDEPNWVYFPNGIAFYEGILDSQTGLRELSNELGAKVYENRFFLPRFYGANHGALIVGPKDTLEIIAYDVNFSDWAFFFADQMKTEALELLDEFDAVVFFPGRDIDDLTLATVNESYRIDLWNYAKPLGFKSEGAWIRDAWWIYDYPTEIPESDSGWLVSAGRPQFETSTATMNIKLTTRNAGLHDLWMRAGFGQDRGLLSLNLDDSVIFEGRLSNKNYEGLKWLRLGSFWIKEGDHTISVSSRNGINSLDELVVIPHGVITSLRNTLENKLSTKKSITLTNPKDEPRGSSSIGASPIDSTLSSSTNLNPPAQIEIRRINPTRYLLTTNLSGNRTFIVFSETYHPLWQMRVGNNSVKPVIAYGGLNCFIIRNNGEVKAEIEFLPQAYLDVGTYVTVFGSIVIISYITLGPLFSRAMSRRKNPKPTGA